MKLNQMKSRLCLTIAMIGANIMILLFLIDKVNLRWRCLSVTVSNFIRNSANSYTIHLPESGYDSRIDSYH
jgi:hypothetical protein